MRVIVTRSNVKDALSFLTGAVSTHQNLPVLKNILIETKQNKIKLTATNLDVAVSVLVSGKVIERGSYTMPHDLLSGIIDNLESERLNISLIDKSKVEIVTDNYRAVLAGIPPEEFPIIPTTKNVKQYFEIGGGVLHDALAQTIISATTSEIRPELQTVLLSYTVDSIKLVATDNFRLAEKSIPSSQFSAVELEPFKTLVPLKTATLVMNALKKHDTFRIFVEKSQIAFVHDEYECISRVIDGSFPDYEHLIPKEFETDAIVQREEFLRAIKLVGVFSGKVPETTLRVLDSKKAVQVASADQAVGENAYVLPAKIRGEACEINFNWRYLSGGVRALGGDEIFLGFQKENKPSLLRTPQDASYFYIVMPIMR